MEFQHDPTDWFWFGYAVATHVHGGVRGIAPLDKVLACVTEIADGTITLGDSADETIQKLGTMSPEAQAEYEKMYGMTPEEMVRDKVNRGIRAQKERAKTILPELKERLQD